MSKQKKRQENEENIIIKYRLDTQTILKLNCSNSRSSTAAKLAKKKFKWFLIRFEWFWILNMLFYITATIEIKVISQMLQ